MHPNDKLLDLLISQYSDSINFIKYLKALTESQNQITVALEDVINKRQLGDASGAQLDVIGRIVGCSRILKGIARTGEFGYYDDPLALGYGDDNNAAVAAGPFVVTMMKVLDYVLNDKLFENWIEARILKKLL